jgi:hypothetical protein
MTPARRRSTTGMRNVLRGALAAIALWASTPTAALAAEAS